MVTVIDHGERPARRILTIEQALRWAYRDELPKARPDGGHNLGRVASSYAPVTRFGELLTVIDENPFGVLHDPSALGAPHPDALVIAAAVDGLAGLVIDIPDDWQPWRDLGELGDMGEAARRQALDKVRAMRLEPRRLVRAFAILRDPPDWCAERPMIRYVSGPGGGGKPRWFRRVMYDGREIEVDGFNPRSRRPYDDAYRKMYLDPDPVQAGIWRAEWQVWVAALDLLTIDLEGQLESIDLRPSGRSLVPWEAPERLGRVLPDISAKPIRPMSLARGHWGTLDTLKADEPKAPNRFDKLSSLVKRRRQQASQTGG